MLNKVRIFSYTFRRFSSDIPSNFPQLVVTTRVIDGSRKCRNLRRTENIPGVLYGKDAHDNNVKVNIQVEKKIFDREIRTHRYSIESTIYKLVLDGTTEHLVIPRQIQLNPCKHLIFPLIL